MIVFEKPGKENTDAAVKIAAERALKDGVHLVVASNSGETARKAAALLEEKKALHLLVVVGQVVVHGKNQMTAENAAWFAEKKVPVISAAHVLSGAERGLSTKMHGIYPVEIIAHSLRMLSQGVKVCVECGIMALDANLLPYGEAIVAVGGTGRGADTCCVLTPAGANEVLECKVHEILCKPY